MRGESKRGKRENVRQVICAPLCCVGCWDCGQCSLFSYVIQYDVM
jgi:hypothetical protein